MGSPSIRGLEILARIAAGDADKDIAAHLAISGRCVSFHVRRALSILGCETRAQAVAVALVRGYIYCGESHDGAWACEVAAAAVEPRLSRTAGASRGFAARSDHFAILHRLHSCRQGI